ncbi:Acetyltransferase family protein [Hyella patelloides LEGE 07179]|uniref:Acetyltransferase family protein n=1 Tax=Hyella patelloides LEGE 07179 TaxID=945734 RepID=A0A563VPX5_9CYAN|nr:GNAT family N-acetyltransferase [Hyella patelloides]VEP13473.1 Acetyltransferase family protein [Hyella patelloides LEGE 07179]
MNDLTIDIATSKDLPILNCLYADMDNKQLMSEEKIAEIWNEIQQFTNYYIYLAYLENKAIGTFSLLFVPTMMHRGFHKSAILDSVAIASAYRSQGWGTKMIKEALNLSTNAGCYKVTLSSNITRKRTHNFYKYLGFQQHGWSFSYQLQQV